MNEEYLRRNLLLASAYGIDAAATSALKRLRLQKHAPKWVIAQFEAITERAVKLPDDLVKWRDLAPDAPSYLTRPKP